MDGLLRTIALMVECTELTKMMDTMEELLRDRSKAKSKEEENKALRRQCDRLGMEIRKTEKELEEAKNRVMASKQALHEVKDNLALPLDVINKARLFEERLEKEEKLSRGHIIRYLGD